MVESLKELNQICQKPRYKEVGNWMVRYIVRDAALPLTWLLLHTAVTANQVSFVSLVIALLGCFFLALKSHGLFLFGVLLLQFWYLLDHVDGQIARYRKTVSLTGRFFDFMIHHVIHGVLFFSLGFYVFRVTGCLFYVVWGFIAALGIMIFNLIHDAKYKTYFEKFQNAKSIEVIESESSRVSQDKGEGPSLKKTLKKIFSVLHKLCEIHVVMNTLTMAAFLQMFWDVPMNFRVYLFMIYSLIIPVIAVAKLWYTIQQVEIDHEFERKFRCR